MKCSLQFELLLSDTHVYGGILDFLFCQQIVGI